VTDGEVVKLAVGKLELVPKGIDDADVVEDTVTVEMNLKTTTPDAPFPPTR
jgi:hypothetical protein